MKKKSRAGVSEPSASAPCAIWRARPRLPIRNPGRDEEGRDVRDLREVLSVNGVPTRKSGHAYSVSPPNCYAIQPLARCVTCRGRAKILFVNCSVSHRKLDEIHVSRAVPEPRADSKNHAKTFKKAQNSPRQPLPSGKDCCIILRNQGAKTSRPELQTTLATLLGTASFDAERVSTNYIPHARSGEGAHGLMGSKNSRSLARNQL